MSWQHSNEATSPDDEIWGCPAFSGCRGGGRLLLNHLHNIATGFRYFIWNISAALTNCAQAERTQPRRSGGKDPWFCSPTSIHEKQKHHPPYQSRIFRHPFSFALANISTFSFIHTRRRNTQARYAVDWCCAERHCGAGNIFVFCGHADSLYQNSHLDFAVVLPQDCPGKVYKLERHGFDHQQVIFLS